MVLDSGVCSRVQHRSQSVAFTPSLAELRLRCVTDPTINPYQPQTPALSSELEPLRFNGVIEQADYQCMLPRDEPEWWVYLVLSVLLGTSLLALGPVIIFVFSDGEPLAGVVLIGYWTLMLGGLWFLKGRVGSTGRTTRWLKKHPDVLGIAQGEFTEEGLSFHDGVRTYWFGPQHLLRISISSQGMRVRVDGSAYYYLALTARLFDGFNAHQANRLKSHWRSLAQKRELDETPTSYKLWNHISKPPDDSIHFQGSITTDVACKTPAIRYQAITELCVYSFTTVILVIAHDTTETWMLWGSAVLLGYGYITNALRWRKYFGQTHQQSWYQSGWISPFELAVCVSNAGVRMPLSQIVQKTEHAEHVLLTMKNGRSYSIFRCMLSDQEQWHQLCALQLTAIQSPQELQPHVSRC